MAHSARTGRQLIRPAHRKILIQCLSGAALGATLALGGIAAHAMGGKPLQQKPQERPDVIHAPEALLYKTLIDIKDNRLDVALREINRVIQAYPTFRLAYLIKGDLLLARARPLTTIGDDTNGPPERLAEFREEVVARLARYQQKKPVGRVPRYLLQLNPEQKYAFVIDASKSTLYVFENHGGTPRYVADYYISSGKNGYDKLKEGDKKTPVGVYHVTSQMPREKLADLYGVGAFPINYPNEWDKREGRNGSGIWLHGTPSNTYSRPPRASDGCVVLTNQDLEAITQNVQVGLTPVIISNSIEWADPGSTKSLRQELDRNVESWRRDWESRATDKYLAHYSASFTNDKQNFASWARQKRQINAGKTWIKVKVDNISMFLYPGIDDLAVVSFEQNYESNNLSNRMRKRQYWIKEKSGWKIIYEGAA